MYWSLALVGSLMSGSNGLAPDHSSRVVGLFDSTGTLEVIVVDSLGTELAWVDLMIVADSSQFRRVGRTSRTGRHLFERLPAKQSYTLVVRRVGLVGETRKVIIESGRRTTITVTMAPFVQRLAEVFAKQSVGSVKGKVVPFGAKEFHWALVELADSAGTYQKTTTVGKKGKFSIKNVPAGGPYFLTVRAMGFETQIISNIEVFPEQVFEVNPLLVWNGDLTIFAPDEKFAQIDPSCGLAQEIYLNGVRLGRNQLLEPLILSEIKPEDILERRVFGCDPAIPRKLRNTIWITARVDREEILAERHRRWKKNRPWDLAAYGMFFTTAGIIVFF